MDESMLYDFNPSLMRYLGTIMTRFPYSTFQLPIPLVRSDYLPSLEHRDSIQNRIDASEDYINSIDQEFQHLQLVARILEEQKLLCQRYSECHRSLIAPIRKLPYEVLAHIFGYTMGESGIYVLANKFWDLQRVCVRWRNVIRSTPSLWKRFEMFDVTPEENASLGPSVTALRMKSCLELSGRLPLSISLRPTYKGVFPISFMEDAANHCDRWEDFSSDAHLLVDAERETKISEIIAKKGLPMLRKLNIFNVDPDGGYGILRAFPTFSFHIFRGASSVEEVDLYGTILPSVHVFPWGSVRKLNLHDCPIPSKHTVTLASVLAATPLLEELAWSTHNDTPDPDLRSLAAVNLPRLHTITLGFCDTGGSSLHFPRLNIPNLKRLELHGSVKGFNFLLSSIYRSQSTPKQIYLRRSSAEFISRVMEQLPTIEDLKITYPSFENDVFASVIQKLVRNHTTESNLLPSLRKLKIVVPNRKKILKPIDVLVEVMRTRCLSTEESNDSVANLTQVTVGGEIDGRRHYKSVIGKLERAGKEYGIKVKSDLRQVEVSVATALLESFTDDSL